MKIAFCVREDLFNRKGGDTIQILKTKEFLEKKYTVRITIVTSPEKISDFFDLVHIFNLSLIDDTLRYIERAKILGIKTVISPIYWDYSYAALSGYRSIFRFYVIHEKLIKLELFFLKIFSFLTSKPTLISRSLKRKFRIALMQVNLVLPNSQEEIEKLCEFSQVKLTELRKRIFIVVNAATETVVMNQSKAEFLAKYKIPEGYVLQIGRIEFIKNQIQTLKALFDRPDLPIVFVGRIFEKDYFEKLESLALKRGNVYFVNEVEHNEVNLFYTFAKLHVLPSLRESPGLVSLEAMLNSCKVVVSDERFAPVHTYFKSYAQVVNPLSIQSVRSGILTELSKTRDLDEIKTYISVNFSWLNTADQTYKAYQSILRK